ncbi:MAG: DUF2202 domain-containing protein, partial [Polyangiaceae bacterium]|nr:DUF2202 domain-containing protein [Polyangiaceae bacterium]
MSTRRRPPPLPITRRRFVGATASGALLLFGCSDEEPLGATPAQADPAAPDGGAQSLTQAEIENLLFLREEEKLARDVYLVLSGTYGKPFTTIEASEQSHMAAVLALLETYGLEDPAALAAPGEFTNPDLKALYDQLVAEGAPSELAALGVGCFIE